MTPGPDVAVDCNRLFVYGTLRRGGRLHHHVERLGASFESEAKVAAELFDLGSYPGALPAEGEGKWVCGEIFLLQQTASDLRVLDRVEGFIPTAPGRCKFIRVVTEVVLPTGACVRAWIYWVALWVSDGRPRIASGDYAAWLARSEKI